MVYCVVPREFEAELFERLKAHYADDPEVTVILDRRGGTRRHPSAFSGQHELRALRDRRRRRVAGELPPLFDDEPPDVPA
ncbi:MAG: hypothetical protein ABSG64_06070 [Solirubrobacteraceae bacterium]|jgi:hypothetical protein